MAEVSLKFQRTRSGRISRPIACARAGTVRYDRSGNPVAFESHDIASFFGFDCPISAEEITKNLGIPLVVGGGTLQQIDRPEITGRKRPSEKVLSTPTRPPKQSRSKKIPRRKIEMTDEDEKSEAENIPETSQSKSKKRSSSRDQSIQRKKSKSIRRNVSPDEMSSPIDVAGEDDDVLEVPEVKARRKKPPTQNSLKKSDFRNATLSSVVDIPQKQERDVSKGPDLKRNGKNRRQNQSWQMDDSIVNSTYTLRNRNVTSASAANISHRPSTRKSRTLKTRDEDSGDDLEISIVPSIAPQNVKRGPKDKNISDSTKKRNGKSQMGLEKRSVIHTDNSEIVSASGGRKGEPFKVNEECLVEHRGQLYQAKVLGAKSTVSSTQYKVHFKGFNKRHDTLVDEVALLKSPEKVAPAGAPPKKLPMKAMSCVGKQSKVSFSNHRNTQPASLLENSRRKNEKNASNLTKYSRIPSDLSSISSGGSAEHDAIDAAWDRARGITPAMVKPTLLEQIFKPKSRSCFTKVFTPRQTQQTWPSAFRRPVDHHRARPSGPKEKVTDWLERNDSGCECPPSVPDSDVGTSVSRRGIKKKSALPQKTWNFYEIERLKIGLEAEALKIQERGSRNSRRVDWDVVCLIVGGGRSAAECEEFAKNLGGYEHLVDGSFHNITASTNNMSSSYLPSMASPRPWPYGFRMPNAGQCHPYPTHMTPAYPYSEVGFPPFGRFSHGPGSMVGPGTGNRPYHMYGEDTAFGRFSKKLPNMKLPLRCR